MTFSAPSTFIVETVVALRKMEIQYLSEPPAQCGRRLLPHLIDRVARDDPDRALISIPEVADAAESYVDVSFKTLATAVDRCAWWLEERLGRSEQLTPIFFIGPTDLRYLIILFAAAKTGHVVSIEALPSNWQAYPLCVM